MPGPLEPAERRGGTKQRRSPDSRRAPCSVRFGAVHSADPVAFQRRLSGSRFVCRLPAWKAPCVSDVQGLCTHTVCVCCRAFDAVPEKCRVPCGSTRRGSSAPSRRTTGRGVAPTGSRGCLKPLEGPARSVARLTVISKGAERTPSGACRAAPRESPGVGGHLTKGSSVGDQSYRPLVAGASTWRSLIEVSTRKFDSVVLRSAW